MPAGGRATVLTQEVPACAAAAAAVCAVVVLAHRVLRIADASSHAIHAGAAAAGESSFPRYGYCEYHFFWPRLGALGELIVQSHLQSETPERAWERWLASSTAAAAGSIPRFNGTWAGFQRLWALRPCPPGPCGPLGQRCPPHFESFECGRHEGDRYCCDAQGCFHDRCDNDGCFPGYVPCDAKVCGRAHVTCGCGRGAGTCGAEAVVKSCGECYSQGVTLLPLVTLLHNIT
eukprot:SAG31_NODE_1404_length_8479_cov_2.258760_5_plen_232_part_00